MRVFTLMELMVWGGTEAGSRCGTGEWQSRPRVQNKAGAPLMHSHLLCLHCISIALEAIIHINFLVFRATFDKFAFIILSTVVIVVNWS